MTGWRVGYIGGPKAAIDAINKLQSQMTSHITSFTQMPAAAALTDPRGAESIEQMRQEFEKRGHHMWERLSAAAEGHLRQAAGRVLLLPEHRRLHRQNSRRRNDHRRGFVQRGAAGTKPRRGRAGQRQRIRHARAAELRDEHGADRQGDRSHRGVFEEGDVGGPKKGEPVEFATTQSRPARSRLRRTCPYRDGSSATRPRRCAGRA